MNMKKLSDLRVASLNKLIDSINDIKFKKYDKGREIEGVIDVMTLIATEYVLSMAAYLLMLPKENRVPTFTELQKMIVDQIFTGIEKAEPIRDALFKKLMEEGG